MPPQRRAIAAPAPPVATGMMTPDSNESVSFSPPGMGFDEDKSFKEFKDYVTGKFQAADRAAADLEARMAEKLNQIDTVLATLEPLRRDVSFFASIKNSIDRTELETQLKSLETKVKGESDAKL